MGKYFVERVNPTLVNPHSIFYENRLHKEPYKFVSGSLEKLKEVVALAFLVCEQTKRDKVAAGEKMWFSPQTPALFGNLLGAPKIEHSTEWFISEVGALGIKENGPCGFGRRLRTARRRRIFRLDAQETSLPSSQFSG